MGQFVIRQRINGEYQFNLKSGNGEIILTSEGYIAKQSCRNGIETVKRYAPYDGNYQRKTSSNSKYYFVLVAGNDQVIGTSQIYETPSGRDNGIESVKKNAPLAPVADSSEW